MVWPDQAVCDYCCVVAGCVFVGVRWTEVEVLGGEVSRRYCEEAWKRAFYMHSGDGLRRH